ncbi:MAG: hypothetical protein G01um101430_311 [Parcubacteria group bacterium Gr01-1014_30]|nr:MAG: hypothetical protein G01um101430_311 [Parcubacteria group bacterium Gr01-1014_30]
MLAKYAENNDCTITVVEDSSTYLEIMKKNISTKYKSDHFTFVYAPNHYKDYLEASINPGTMDLVVIDGPDGEEHRLYNKFFYEKIIGPETTCIIDDTDYSALDRLAEEIARRNSLKKIDFRDAFYSKAHQYSILFPQTANTKEII